MNLHGNGVTHYLFTRWVMPHPRLRRLLMRWWSAERDCWVRIGSVPLRINSHRESGYLNAARNADGSVVLRDEIGSLLNLALLLAPGDTFVDVGANVGFYSAALSRLATLHPATRFYAFEAHPGTFARLTRTLEASPVELRNTAVSDRVGALRFCEGGVSGVFHVAGAGEAGTVEIPATTLDAAGIGGEAIVLKIDVEGHEMPVLAGAAELFARERVKAVFIDGFREPAIPGWLRERGFALFGGRVLTPYAPGSATLLAVHRRHLGSREIDAGARAASEMNPVSGR